ncbi:hypothetical protein [Goodfellowiella coeruleoviolacea]|uniref:Uncharacterized protein n=1 Tax=Goodfellowiella coeruleoviolacea TaxID=334858 RepID=A0AAE3GKF6_9PSEU|nr:hypothetical protein [Goodfellowiella coeruleoviolacea]MCP2169092.1 hypothetical protein [Goodfellowiella coeruleoviolacea]
MTSTLTYGHSPFATPQVHAWLADPDKPDFSRALCGIRLADTLITTYARPTRDNATWCGACCLLTEHAPDDHPTHVMRRSAVDGGNHVIPADALGGDRTYRALCGQYLTDAVATPASAWPCDDCLDAATALLRQEVPG